MPTLAIDASALLVTTGDAQDWMASQDETALTGKTLRIDIDPNGGNFGQPKADNPNLTTMCGQLVTEMHKAWH